MKYFLASGLAALALGGCLNDNPFYVDPTGASATTSEGSTITVGGSSTSVATTEGSTGDPDTDDDTTSVGTTVSTSTTTAGTSGTSGAMTMDTGDDTGANTTMQAPFCGDGDVNEGELCDDGNDNDLDGCTVACLPTPSVEGLIPTGSSDLVGQMGPFQGPGLCVGLLTGISIAADEEAGILRVKLLCHNYKLASLGGGAFEVELVGDVLYGDYIGSDALAANSWPLQCPPEAPVLVGIGGWATDSGMAKLELECAELHVLPQEDSYKLDYQNLQYPTEGYNGWGVYQPPVDCKEYPGSLVADLLVHTSAQGVTGFQALCAKPDFGV